jgi:hypothetical protein
LVNECDGFEFVQLVLSEHFALATRRFAAILAEIVEVYAVILTFLNLLAELN